MKKNILLFFVLVCSLGLVACGNKDTGKKNSNNTLKILLEQAPPKNDALDLALQKWAKEKGKKIEKIIIPYDDQLTKFPLMLKNKDVPDLLSTTRLNKLYPKGFEDLSKKINTSNFDATALQTVNNYGKDEPILAIPHQYTITNYYYNTAAFEKAGIQAPTEDTPWSLEELYSNAKIIQEKSGIKYGFAVDFSRARYDNLMYSNGGSMVEKSGKSYKVTINSDENIKTLERFKKENDSGVMPKVIWTGGSSDNPADYFANGDVAIYLSGTWNYPRFHNEIKSFDFSVMPSPKGLLQQSTITGGHGLAVPKDGKNKNLAVDFLKWLYTEHNYKEFIKNDKAFSFIKGIKNDDDNANVQRDFDLMQKEMKNVTKELDVDEESQWRNHLDNEYRDAIKGAVSGEISAEDALDEFAKQLSEKSSWKLD